MSARPQEFPFAQANALAHALAAELRAAAAPAAVRTLALVSTIKGHAIASLDLVDRETARDVARQLRGLADAYDRRALEADD